MTWDTNDDDYVEWSNDLVGRAPSRFDGDEALEAIITQYVRALEDEVMRINPRWFRDT